MPNDAINFDEMSDEDFMKLDPSQMEEVPSEEVVVDASDVNDELEDETTPDDDTGEGNSSTSGDTLDSEGETKTPVEDEKLESNIDPLDDANAEVKKTPVKTEKVAKGEDEKSAKPDGDEKPDEKAKTNGDVDTATAVDFYTKVSASFKADGRDMQVRSPEDAIRLMQMGVNYSRRMAEMKPLRAQDQMLKLNGLNDPEKLNFLIDVSKGKPEAIQKLLKDHQIDPIDIDTSVDSKYQATNYQGDPKDLEFDDAIQATITSEGGPDLIRDINKDWDDVSKEALRDQPAIFQNILAQRVSGVYSKIKTELEYQRKLGYLTNVPFLQAYNEVGKAMQVAGVFDTEGKAQPTETPKKVLPGTGNGKVAPKPKTEQPTPNISSASPPRSAPSKDGGQNEPDYSSMSDEDFMKMAPPG